MSNILFFSLATTGNNPNQCDLIEITGRLVRMGEPRVHRDFTVRQKPSLPIAPEASAVNGWTQYNTQALPVLSRGDLSEALAPYFAHAHYLCAHGGMSFHFRALAVLFHETGIIRKFNKSSVFDTFLMTKRWHPDLPSYQLLALAHRFGFPEVLGDTPVVPLGFPLVEITQRLWEHVVFEVAGSALDLAALNAWQYEVPTPTVFTFGPYRGKTFLDVWQTKPGAIRYYLAQGWVKDKYPGDYQAMKQLVEGGEG